MDDEVITETLEAFANNRDARRARKDIRTLRGVRGVANSEIARIAAAAWQEDRPHLPQDGPALDHLFSNAFEDGLVAIGLLAAAGIDHPDDALDLGLDWLTRVDDLATADALGWLVLGPSTLASATPITELIGHGKSAQHPAARRAIVAAGLAMTTEKVEGPAAAPLRKRLQNKRVVFVEEALSDGLSVIATAFARDDTPGVRKALRRLLRAWTRDDPSAVATWGETFIGGLHKMLGAEVKRARKRAATPPGDASNA